MSRRYLILVILFAASLGLYVVLGRGARSLPNEIREQIGGLGSIGAAEVYAFKNLSLPPAQVQPPDLFRDGCKFRETTPERIGGLVDIIERAQLAIKVQPVPIDDTLGIVLKSKTGEELTFIFDWAAAQHKFEIRHKSQIVVSGVVGNDAFDEEVYTWLKNVPVRPSSQTEISIDASCSYYVRNMRSS